MSKFDKLKKEAEIAIEQKWFNRLREEDAIAILELLAIQAQLVKALNRIIKADDDQALDSDDIEVGRAALAAAKVQP